MIKKLDEKFKKRYSKMFAELNSSINILPKGDDNTYEAQIGRAHV